MAIVRHSSLFRLQFAADFFCLLHHTEDIAAKDFANVPVAVALAHQGFGDFWQHRAIVHTFGHCCAVEIGTEADVVRADELHNVIDVIEDSIPTHKRQLAYGSRLLHSIAHNTAETHLIFAAFHL